MIDYGDLHTFALSTIYNKLIDSTYVANCTTYGRWVHEKLNYQLLCLYELKRAAEFVEYDDEEIESYFREEMQGLQGKFSDIESKLGDLTEEIELFNDTLLGTIISHIDEQFRMMREDFLIERGKL